MNNMQLFQQPPTFSYSSTDEKGYRVELAHYLNEEYSHIYSEAVLMTESNSHVVYKVTKKSNNAQSIIKFFRYQDTHKQESAALNYWQAHAIKVPVQLQTKTIALKHFTTYLTEMEYVAGENMLTAIRKGTLALTPEYGIKTARVLTTIDIPFTGDASIYSPCLYEPQISKMLAIPTIESSMKIAWNTYQQWKKSNKEQLVHGDFRDGNMILNGTTITLLDPGPALGHIATDFGYYLARSFIAEFTSHLPGFISTFIDTRKDLDIVRSVALLECGRLYIAFNTKEQTMQREKLRGLMTKLVNQELF